MEMYRYDVFKWTNKVELKLTIYSVVKETKCGVFIDMHNGTTKFINTNNIKQFANKTKEEAFHAFRCRKHKQIAILKHQLLVAQASLELNKVDVEVQLPMISVQFDLGIA